MDTKPPAIDPRLALGHGSAWHLLRCLGWHRERFTARITKALGASRLTWLDFPAYGSTQVYPSGVPIRDGEWTGVNFCGDAALKKEFAEFWPSRGSQQNWDAIGKAEIGGKEEWILVEAKAHLAEVSASGTSAAEDGGRPTIRKAFVETLQAMGYEEAAATQRAEAWLTGYYQNANRLATLHFFTKKQIPARLVFLYFCGDQGPDGKSRPANGAGWSDLLDKVHSSLGLSGTSDLEKRVYEIFMPVDLATAAPQ